MHELGHFHLLKWEGMIFPLKEVEMSHSKLQHTGIFYHDFILPMAFNQIALSDKGK